MSRGTFVAHVPSLTRADAVPYVVTLVDGELHCDCPPFTMGPKKGQDCKHLRLYAAAVQLLQRCAELHGLHDEGLCKACLVGLLAASARKVNASYMKKDEAKAKVAAARARKKQRRVAKSD